MTRTGWITAVVALDLAILVATSEPHYEDEDASEPVEIELSPKQRDVHVYGEVAVGGPAYSHVLSLSFDGYNAVSETGKVSLYQLPPDATEIPLGSVQMDNALVDARPGQPAHVTFSLNYPTAPGPFHLVVHLDGRAELLGELTVSAYTESTEGEVSVKLSDVEVSP
jgi:hypothetical protein